MAKAKATDTAPSQTTAPLVSTGQRVRKPWKKKTPVEILLDQRDKLQEEITRDEDALKEKREQLKKFEEAAKLFEKK